MASNGIDISGFFLHIKQQTKVNIAERKFSIFFCSLFFVFKFHFPSFWFFVS